MATISFTTTVDLSAPAADVWTELIDWKGHEAWIPATRVDLGDHDDPAAPGAEFTAWTGFGKLALEDRMRVVSCSWSDDTEAGSCTVEKLGPVLRGSAGFEVEATDGGSQVTWIEDVELPYVPQFLAPIVAKLSAAGFTFGLRRLGKLLANRPHPEPATS